MNLGYSDFVYRKAESGERCNWEGDKAGTCCESKAAVVLYLSEWVRDDAVNHMEVFICSKHLLCLVSELLRAYDFCSYGRGICDESRVCDSQESWDDEDVSAVKGV